MISTAGLQVLGTLLRKDLRTSRWFIAGLALWLVCNRLIHSGIGLGSYPATLIEYVPSLLAVLWGATNGDSRDRNHLFERTHLPINVYHLWLTSAVFPVIIITVSALLAQIQNLAAGSDYSALFCLLPNLLALFMLSCFVSSISSSRTAVVAGISIIIIGPFIIQPFHLQSVAAWGIFFGTNLSILLFLMLRGMICTPIRIGIYIIVIAAAVIVPSIPKARESLQDRYNEHFSPHIYAPADKAVTILPMSNRKFVVNAAQYRNERTGEVYIHRFESNWHVAWADKNGGVYVLESVPDEHSARIALWKTRSGSYRTLIRLPLQPNFDTLCTSGHFASVDPSGHYMIARLPALRNSSADLWLFDLKLKTGQVVFQNAAHLNPGQTRWIADTALIPSYRLRVVKVSTSTKTAVCTGSERISR
ncbi:MAG: hypothetical protein ABFD46_11500 [Armatimonadota bacterium]